MDQMFPQHHDRDWEHNEFDLRERRSSFRGKEIRPIKLRQMDRWKRCRPRRYHHAKFGELVGSGRLHRLENLNNIKVSALANREIAHIVRNQNTEMAWARDARKSQIQPAMFSELHGTVKQG
jgi:hypothetical protein